MEDQNVDRVWLSVVMSEDLKKWVRVRAASASKSASAFVRELVEKERGNSRIEDVA